MNDSKMLNDRNSYQNDNYAQVLSNLASLVNQLSSNASQGLAIPNTNNVPQQPGPSLQQQQAIIAQCGIAQLQQALWQQQQQQQAQNIAAFFAQGNLSPQHNMQLQLAQLQIQQLLNQHQPMQAMRKSSTPAAQVPQRDGSPSSEGAVEGQANASKRIKTDRAKNNQTLEESLPGIVPSKVNSTGTRKVTCPARNRSDVHDSQVSSEIKI